MVERLREYVTYERTRRYQELYELLYERNHKEQNDKNAPQEVYSKSRLDAESRRGVVQEFMPTFILNITLNEGDAHTFSLTGRAKVLLKGRTVKKGNDLIRETSRGEWYFTELSDSFLHID